MKRGLAIVSAVVALASAVALWRAAASAGDVVKPAVPASDLLRRAYPAAAREAIGRRVLVLRADPGKPLVAEILESGRAPEGWSLFPGVSPAAAADAPEFGAALSALASAAGASHDRDRGVSASMVPALSLFCVKTVIVDDAGKGAVPVTVLKDAEPVLRVNARPAGRLTTSDPVSLAAALAATPG
ncbi:MAG: hypothetical protein K8T90_03845, partial [Planctomycetes bacterium]|nr:hypothetical protein [Planctomycetota bacterium]